jgi:hypothetical protein
MESSGRITRDDVERALGSLALEGGTVSDELSAAIDDVVAGRRDLDEVVAATIARYDRSGETSGPA